MAFVALVPAIYINVKQYGAVGNGSTDDTAAIQAAIAAATTGSVVFFPQGIYIVSATITYPGNVTLQGSGDSENGTVLRVKPGASLATPVLASADWYNNATTCGNPVHIADLQIDGNSATSGTAAHGLVLMNFWSCIERCTVNNVAGDGFLYTAFSLNGTHITNSCVEGRLLHLQSRNAGQVGIHVKDDGTTTNSCTDGFLESCTVQSAGTRGIYIEMGPGWLLTGNHVYGTATDGIYVKKCYATRVVDNYIDGYGSGANTYIAGIGMDVLDGRGSTCIGNTVNFESGTATGPYQAVVINGTGSAVSVCHVAHNLVNGGSQSGSLAYVLQSSGSQVGHPFIVYFSNNDWRGVATSVFADSNTSGGDVNTFNHFTSDGAAATAAAGAQAGSSPPAPVITGTDVDGNVTFGTGGSATAGAQVVVTFAHAYAAAPSVVITPANSATASLTLYVASTTGGFTVSCVGTPASSQTNTHFSFNYHVMA